jgi:hypothetical protein
VAKGYTQQYGIDYFEVWAPTGRLAAYRALLTHAAHFDLPVELLDFTTAFLNGPLKEEIYVSQPPGFCDGSRQVWRLQRALYGLKQAANAWHTTFVEELISIGYKASVVDPAIFVRQCRDGVVILHTHVDDCAGTGPPEEVQKDYGVLLQRFEGRRLGEIDRQVFLGIYHERDWDAHTISISQPRHVDKLLVDHGFASARPLGAPLDHKVALRPASENSKRVDPCLSSYASIVGGLMYIANSTRPDICFAVSMLARFMSSPADEHVVQAKHALRYLAGTKDYKLVLGGKNDSRALVVYGDADHATCPETRRSTSGLVVMMHGSAVHWRSCRQSAVAKSTMIAEYYAASSAADESVYFRNLLRELGYNLGPIPLCCDNRSASAIIEKPIVCDKSKYAEIHAHYVRERVARGEIVVEEVRTEDQLADALTKALVPVLHKKACVQLRLERSK